MDSIAGIVQNFLQHIAEGLIWIYKQDTLDSFRQA